MNMLKKYTTLILVGIIVLLAAVLTGVLVWVASCDDCRSSIREPAGGRVVRATGHGSREEPRCHCPGGSGLVRTLSDQERGARDDP